MNLSRQSGRSFRAVFGLRLCLVVALFCVAFIGRGATITAINRNNNSPTNATSVSYTVVFSQAVSGVTASNFSVALTGSATGTVSSVSGTGNTYTVTVNNVSGDGTLTLNATDGTGITPALTGLPFTGQTYTIDNTAPEANALYMQSNNPDYTKAVVGNTVTLVFGAPETFTYTVSIGGHDVSSSAVSIAPNRYSVGYTMTASDPPGRVHFTLVMTDLAGNSSTWTDLGAGDDIEFSLSSAISSINLQNPASAVTKTTSVTWRANFSLAVSGVGTSNFSLMPNGTATGSITSVTQVSGPVYDVKVDNVSGDGTLTLNLSNGNNITPALTSTLPFAGESYTIDNTPPNAQMGNPSVNSTSVGPVSYNIYYGDLNLKEITLSLADITFNKTGTANGTLSLSHSGNVYTVTISNITGSGTLGISVAAGTASDLAGNEALAVTSPVFNVVSANATLSSLSVGGTTLTPEFDKTVVTYYATVPNSTTSIAVTPTATDYHSSLTVNGTHATTGVPFTVQQLSVGDNGITIKVTAEDGSTTETYTIYITRQPSSVATLTGLSAEGGVTLSPAFNSNILSYQANVPFETSSVSIVPIITDATATMKANGVPVTSGSAAAFPLNVGLNTLTFLVKAQDSVTIKTYTVSITRAKSPQTITFNALPAKVYGNADFAPGATSSNNSIPVTYSSDNTAVATIVNGQIHIVSSGIANITASQAGNDTYLAATNISRPLNVGKAAIAITADAQSKIYGQADPALTYKITTGSLVGTDAFTGALTRDAGENAGSYAIKQGTLSLGANYTISFTGANLVIGKAPVTVTADAQTKVYGQADPVLTYKLTSGTLVGTDKLTGTLSRDAGEGVGTYSITQGTLTAGTNYTLNFIGSKLSITPVELTITAENKTKVYGGANPVLTVTYNGFINGDNSSKLTKLPTISTTAVAGSPVGDYAVTASGAVSADYTIVYKPGTLTVTKASLTVKADDKTRIFGKANPVLTLTYSGFVNNDNPSKLTTQPTATVSATVSSPAGSYPIKVSGGVSPNYTFAYVDGTLTVVGSSNAALAGLSISAGSLSPSFASGRHDYEATVDASVQEVTLTPTVEDALATVKVDGSTVASGSASSPVSLGVGHTTIRVVVTAGDGVTRLEYDVDVTRNQPPVAEIKPTNILTPNGDGKNDTWLVPDIQLFPDNLVKVFDRGGRQVYAKHGYNNDWDGTLNGNPLPEGTYYYIVDLGGNNKLIRGYITILRSK